MLRDFVSGFIKIHILHHAAQAPVYGLALIEELRRHGYELSPGTLYPILHAMEEAGYLASEQEAEAGKVRRYYRATRDGEAVLEELKARIRELTAEVLKPVPRPRRRSGGSTKRSPR
jgi:PadR family transcriptional regulator, regulatory protein PadR